MLEPLSEWAIEVVETLGYVGVALLVFIENVFPPIPSEVVLALAGFVASRGDATVPGMIAASTAGSLVGALVLYGGAAWFGPMRLRAIVVRYHRWHRITEGDLDRAEAFFDRWSTTAVLVCRCIPLVRSLISVPAGLRRMPLLPFILYTTAGSLVWNSIFVIAGYQLGERWEDILPYADYIEYAVLAVIFVIVVFLAWQWYVRGRVGPAGSSPPSSDR
jgi:membrane protein DedA with SNARE-associated domain